MRRKSILLFAVACGLLGFSCSGVKNMSSTLSKSDSRTSTVSDTKHGDYLNQSTKVDTVSARKAYVPATNRTEETYKSNDTYKKDYGRLTDTKPDNATGGNVVAGNPDVNQKLVNLYSEMDKLGDVVLYEIDITERRYSRLLDQFKTANANDRDLIAKDLDKLSADQLLLYKTYTQIYKNGKADWPRVKADVEATLMNLRGVDRK
ncbi:hypothetical protein [Dyadobacter sp. CY312]|uniref:hypothetical protein n=1 Tax=Dyadobacter sp. CY312 TaxID=2907303 RepID=UPI001F18714C|nr:hypothetical protein [Dyadobacter sp. CY312]MCE7039638.1 hypothetical protein [Dyadobacter sp. CY312]